MNLLTIFFESLFGFIRRNPVTCIVLVVVALLCPPLFGFVLWAFAALIVLSVVSALLLLWRLRSVRKSMEEQIRDAQSATQGFYQNKKTQEGDVSVHRTSSAPEKKINSDVGEYVDFEEEKKN